MKKLKLTLDDLTVTSFAAEDEAGAVHGMQMSQYPCESGKRWCEPSYIETQCLLCTEAEGCYGSMYCTGYGCVLTADPGCVTDNNSPC
jgi:hypothetical protein